MGLIDKIKDALFEVEYVEVDEPPKKEKKEKEKVKDKEEKPIAKKIVLPGKRHEKVEEIKEEELKDDNFEARPINETVKEEKKEEFKIMNDNDFKMDDEYLAPIEEPKILEVIDNVETNEVPVQTQPQPQPQSQSPYFIENLDEPEVYTTREEKYNYTETVVTEQKTVERQSKPYGMDSSYNVPVHEYGGYEKKEEKTGFRPSPIISPIYGILDKNYRKEDVVQKREVRISSYTRSNMNVDDIRNKAYGKDKEKVVEEKKEPKKVEVAEEEENLFVDLTDDKEKPEVKELTMGDAMEYFQDLGLEYNVDYVDASTGKNQKTPSNFENLEDDIQNEIDKSEDKPIEVIQPKEEIREDVKEKSEEEPKEKKVTEKKTSVVEIKDESDNPKKNDIDDDDNLFDLIDSMYKEED